MNITNFTNNTVSDYSNYIGQGFFSAIGSMELVGLIIVLFFLLICYFTKIPFDASVFIMFMVFMFLGLYGLLPMAVFIIGVIASGIPLAWVVFKSIRS